MKHKKNPQSLHSFKRILIKISGEVLSGSGATSVDLEFLKHLVSQVATSSQFFEIALVIGAGNFFRGAFLAQNSFTRDTGDCVGMLGTVMNSLLFQDLLLQQGIKSCVFSGIPIKGITQTFLSTHRDEYFRENRVVIFAGGLGQPYFTTDTAAIIWALRSGCQAVFKGTKVDGVYSEDPEFSLNATFLSTLTHDDVLQKKLRVMDLTALTLANETRMPIAVFNIRRPEGLRDVLKGESPFTWIE